jgi:hypothetical protein
MNECRAKKEVRSPAGRRAFSWGASMAKRNFHADLARFVADEDGDTVIIAGLGLLAAAVESDHDCQGADFIDGFAAGICRLVFQRYGWDRSLFVDEWHDRAPVVEAPEPDWWEDWPPEGLESPPSLKDGFTREYEPWDVRLP